jgi:hypothetical protein
MGMVIEADRIWHLLILSGVSPTRWLSGLATPRFFTCEGEENGGEAFLIGTECAGGTPWATT